MEQRKQEKARLEQFFLDHYLVVSGSLAVYVRELIEGKPSEYPVRNAQLSLLTEDGKSTNTSFTFTGESYRASGIPPGRYVLKVCAPGYAAADGRDEEARVLEMPELAGTPQAAPPVLVWLLARDVAGEGLPVSITPEPETGKVRNSKQDSQLKLTAVVTRHKDSGKLRYQWATGEEVLADGGEDVSQIVFSGEGRNPGAYPITVLVIDEKERESVGRCTATVVSAADLPIKFAEHRKEIFRGQGERVQIAATPAKGVIGRSTGRSPTTPDACGSIGTRPPYSRSTRSNIPAGN